MPLCDAFGHKSYNLNTIPSSHVKIIYSDMSENPGSLWRRCCERWKRFKNNPGNITLNNFVPGTSINLAQFDYIFDVIRQIDHRVCQDGIWQKHERSVVVTFNTLNPRWRNVFNFSLWEREITNYKPDKHNHLQ